jgi:cysteinyl-tRNA synthetase
VALSLYNTKTRVKQLFEPLKPGYVGMYVCGPTVYDLAHVGNARPAVVFDVLYRLLQSSFDEVCYVRNITDVDDKIIAASEKSGEAISEITARTTQAYHEDMTALGVLPPDIEPRATAHIAQMIDMIESLIEKGHAYEAEGHVLFAVASDLNYGKLSGRNRDEMIAGARVEVAPYKKDPADFVLWKPSTDTQAGWDSPWGWGRPGWHIECSAMSREYLGTTFDIHGGGRDLVFPHHENEAAQSTCADKGSEFARYWVHNGFLTVEGEKMSKSIGNVLLVRDLVGKAPGEAIRLNMLSSHYRQPMDWTEDGMAQARKTLDRWYRAAGDATPLPCAAVTEALEDDLNSPKAIAALHELAGAAAQGDAEAAGKLRGGAALLGVLLQTEEAWFQGDASADHDIAFLKNLQGIDPDTVTLINIRIGGWEGYSEEKKVAEFDQCMMLLINARNQARKDKDFQSADAIRDLFQGENITLEDGADGTTWRRT